MELVIRSAEIQDFTQVYSLFKQLWQNQTLDNTALNQVFQRGVISENDVLLCAELDGRVIGFCAYAIVNNLWQAGYISYVYAMVVDEAYRGMGYGSKLISEVISDSKLRGLKRVELDSAFHRENAHKFYIKHGFEKRAYLFSYTL